NDIEGEAGSFGNVEQAVRAIRQVQHPQPRRLARAIVVAVAARAGVQASRAELRLAFLFRLTGRGCGVSADYRLRPVKGSGRSGRVSVGRRLVQSDVSAKRNYLRRLAAA